MLFKDLWFSGLLFTEVLFRISGLRERFEGERISGLGGFEEGLREGWFLAVIENELFINTKLTG